MQVPNAPEHSVPMLHVLALTPFVDPLPLPMSATASGPNQLRIAMREIQAKIHRDVPATRMWSYVDLAASRRASSPLAPIIEARVGRLLQIEWVNELPARHIFQVDHSLHGCGRDIPEVRTSTHVHGAKVATKDDGYPEDWFVRGQSRVCHYPNQQGGTLLWYHDHAMGLNRLSTYAGLFGLYILRDPAEDALNLPAGKYEIPLILYDREFTADGQLFYPTSGDREHPWVPEFVADGILINGKLRPYLEVEPRLYRFRLLNAANSRFFALSLSNRQALTQIGSDQGLLVGPVDVNLLALAPGERADVLIDFSQLSGQTVQLRTGVTGILEFRVGKTSSGSSRATTPRALRTIERIPESAAMATRTITLSEYQDKIGNPTVMLLNGKRWHEPVTETPRLNTTEIWEFVNLTQDTHPMHIHLVRFQLLDRRVFEPYDYVTNKRLRFTAPVELPAANESGWKDTIQCPAGMITRVILRFEGYAGKYLYHCHILEHEANDMMRPFEVMA